MKYEVSVRSLCEFTARKGDLDMRFSGGPSAIEGIAGHGRVTSRRPPHYEREITLIGEYRHLVVRGRADGFDHVENRLEEIKTYRGDLASMPRNQREFHWAQLRIYGHMLCEKLGLPVIHLTLVYFDIASESETLLDETADATGLRRYFEQHCEYFLCWSEQELGHRHARDESLAALRFPHSSFREGQRQLAETVYRTARQGASLMAQAPTGIGKTIGTLFPFLKACPSRKLDKVFFLTAKTSGRQPALDALALMHKGEQRLNLRVLELISRDKACEHPDKLCHGESCPLARGFYDRLPAARAAALAICELESGEASSNTLSRNTLRAVALDHGICPYYLSQELIRWSDVVVGDYNHYFDLNATLHELTVANQWRVGVLVDEAHNLLERARKMYTAELNPAILCVAYTAAPSKLRKPLGRLQRCWNKFGKGQDGHYSVYSAIPDQLTNLLQRAIAAVIEHAVEDPNGLTGALRDFYFEALHFRRISELFDKHWLFDSTKAGRSPGKGDLSFSLPENVLCLRNIVPAPFLAQRFASAQASVLFSATLAPPRFYRDMLGLSPDTTWIDVPSPFKAEQLSVRIVSHISTRFQERDASISPIVDLISRQYKTRPANYLSFFSSYDYLRQVVTLLRSRYPEIPVKEQTRGMEETEQAEFLAGFTSASQHIGFVVLGGSFAEAIDLPGKRLVGAFIATLGLPQVNGVNEQMRQRMETLFGAGYEYAYFFPGIQKVVQAAGRVIRTQQDEGVIYLIDDRYARMDVRQLLPTWWEVKQLKKERQAHLASPVFTRVAGPGM
ncbi:MAG TPA: ATP-dependent DNA helicase [Nitrosospira sp.]|nr:ATP-dependent DNA helicase [Nitrosospira sp.]